MNPPPDPDHEQRLADLTAALQALGRAPTEAESAALAEQHGVSVAVVADCGRALAALAHCLAAAPAVATPTELPDTYEVLGELGRGGMGVVFRARHRALGREVAIKVLQPGESSFQELLRRFETEAKSLARLRHPHIVAVHDVGRSGGHVWYTMDLIDGTSLDKELKKGAMPPSRAVRLLTEVASAIEHSHAHGVIHRDLKPANILLDANDAAFVADFGLARDRNVPVELTTTGQIMGTPAYMSPEAMRGDNVGERTDVWALGAMLYEALTGVAAFRRDNFADTMHAVLREEPVALRKRNPRVPRDLELVCAKALAKLPDERYATARAFREDLDRFQQGLPVLAQRPDLRRRLQRWFGRNRAAVLGAVASSAVVALVLGLSTPGARTPDAIDATIRTANDREQQGDHVGALQLYDLAREVLGTDQGRALRHGNDVTSSSLLAHVWRGILDCRAELAWQRVGKGEGAPAAAEFAGWLQQCPRSLRSVQFDAYSGELAALQALAGEPAAATDTLRAAIDTAMARPAEPTNQPRSVFAWSTVVRRLRPFWSDPAHAEWRTAGRLLAAAVAFAEERPFDLRLGEFDATGALVAAWACADALAPAARERLRAHLREATFGGHGPLQWGGPDPTIVRALADLIDDKDLAGFVRGEALDVLCAIADLPWRPAAATRHLAVDGGRGAEAKVLALRTLERSRDEAWQARIAFALELQGTGDGGAVDVAAWLSDHTGADPSTDFAAWWATHRGAGASDLLARALGERAVVLRGDALSRHFATLTGQDRARYHHWLRLQAADPQRVPLWPAGEAEPQNLVASWAVGVRDAAERYFYDFAMAGLRVDGTGWDMGTTLRSSLELDQPLQTWISVGTGLPRWQLSPTRALAEAPHRLTWSLPGAEDLAPSHDHPAHRVEIHARMTMTDQPGFSWGVDVSSPPGPERWFVDDVGPDALATCSVRVLDGWFGGFDGEAGGPRVYAFLAGKSRAKPADADAIAWRQAVLTAAGTLRDLAAQGDDAAFTTALTDGRSTARTFEVLARIPARMVDDGLLPHLRTIDERARDLFAKAGTEPARLERLVVPLAARLQTGDGSALDEPGFAARLAAAERALGLGPWWWYRVFCAASDAPLRSLAGERLATMELPDQLLLQVARNKHGSELPEVVQQSITRLDDERATARAKVVAVLVALMAVVIAAGIVSTCSALRRRGSRRWLQSATSLLALSSLGVVVVQSHFGTWRLPPVSFGLAGLALTAWLLLRARADRLGLTSASVATMAFVGGLAAENAWHPFANAIGSMVAALACGLLALQVARTMRRLAGFGWIPALPLFAAAAGGAAVGLDVLVRGRDVASFTTAVQQTAWADWVAATSGVGVVTLAALLLLTGLAGLRRNHPGTAHPVLS
ncbi:MAG: protein kinase [Planctomycetes bacterium]|nr:protein kinase [Planctomycetota bacterium]